MTLKLKQNTHCWVPDHEVHWTYNSLPLSHLKAHAMLLRLIFTSAAGSRLLLLTYVDTELQCCSQMPTQKVLVNAVCLPYVLVRNRTTKTPSTAVSMKPEIMLPCRGETKRIVTLSGNENGSS